MKLFQSDQKKLERIKDDIAASMAIINKRTKVVNNKVVSTHFTRQEATKLIELHENMVKTSKRIKKDDLIRTGHARAMIEGLEKKLTEAGLLTRYENQFSPQKK